MTLGLGNAFFRLTYCLDALTGGHALRLAQGGLGIRSMATNQAINAIGFAFFTFLSIPFAIVPAAFVLAIFTYVTGLALAPLLATFCRYSASNPHCPRCNGNSLMRRAAIIEAAIGIASLIAFPLALALILPN